MAIWLSEENSWKEWDTAQKYNIVRVRPNLISFYKQHEFAKIDFKIVNILIITRNSFKIDIDFIAMDYQQGAINR